MKRTGPRPTRRGLMRTAAALAAARAGPALAAGCGEGGEPLEGFWGPHQAGITTLPMQQHSCAVAFDLVTTERDEVKAMLRRWTAAAARMSYGQTAKALIEDGLLPEPDSGEALGLPAARLTVTFGFGAGLFVRDGKDRYGLAERRPAALVELPVFNGDELEDARTGGDIAVQACADDPQVAFHAVRQLARLAERTARLHWAQAGFVAAGPQQTPRNLLGFKDGTRNPPVHDRAAMQRVIWVGDEGPGWMQGGSYVVMRRIRVALAHWDRMPLGFQEQAFGRAKYSGAPLGGADEFDPPDLAATDRDGDKVIPDNAHIRLAAAATNGGAEILRRSYSYNDGAAFVAERWPPWRRGVECDAGLFFVCYQRDPRRGFIPIFERLSKFDMLNQFVTHTGGGLFACPGGIAPGEFVGQRLFA